MIVGKIAGICLIAFSLVGGYACGLKKPDFGIGKNFEFIEDRNGSTIRYVVIEQYDSINNFVGKKYIYKDGDSEGRSRIYLFSENKGYYFNGDTLKLSKGFIYKIHIRTLGFVDSLVLKPK